METKELDLIKGHDQSLTGDDEVIYNRISGRIETLYAMGYKPYSIALKIEREYQEENGGVIGQLGFTTGNETTTKRFQKVLAKAKKELLDSVKTQRIEILAKVMRRYDDIYKKAFNDKNLNVALGANNAIAELLRLKDLDIGEDAGGVTIQIIKAEIGDKTGD